MRLTVTRYIFFAALFSGGFWYIETFRIQSPRIIVLNENSAGKTLVIKKGQEFTLILPDHVDGGYRFDSIQYNAAIISLQKHSGTPPSLNSPPGRPGKSAWYFEAIKKGETTVKVSASRPWKGGGTVTVFENKVMVK